MNEVRQPVATIHPGAESDLFFLADVLRRGELVAVPTETVYGLAANALDPAACRRIFEAKGRPTSDPLIVHVAGRSEAGMVAHFTDEAERLAAAFWPGPLTLVLSKKPAVPDIVTANRPTVAVRVPAHPLFQRLLEICGLPLAAPSANLFTRVSPTEAAHVEAGLGDRIGHILDGGPCRVGVESTIVDLREPGAPAILRPGGLAVEAIEDVLGRRVRRGPAAGDAREGAPAPGMMEKHYSPRTPLGLREAAFTPDELARDDGIARVVFARNRRGFGSRAVSWLSESGDPAEAAQRLYALMRELDARGWARIEFEPAPDHGLGLAINDRLRRAAAR